MKTLKRLEEQYDLGKCKLEPANRELCDRLDKYAKQVNVLVLEEESIKELAKAYNAGEISQITLLDAVVKKMIDMVECYIIKEYQYMCCNQGYQFKNIKEFIDFQKEYIKDIEKLTEDEIVQNNTELMDEIGKDNFIFTINQSVIYYKTMIKELEILLQWSIV